MSAVKKSSFILLCLALAITGLVGVFTIINASSARADQSVVPLSAIYHPTSIVISPAELQATLHPGEQLTQTMWITNTGDVPLTYTIFEISAPIGISGVKFQPAAHPLIAPDVQSRVDQDGKTPVLIFLHGQPDLSPAYLIPDKVARREYVYTQLLETARHSQLLFNWLQAQGAQPHRLLAVNAIAATLDQAQLTVVADYPQVSSIQGNSQHETLQPLQAIPLPLAVPKISSIQPEAVEWNIAKIRADEAWATFGITGTGAVVGIVDTGVMYNHAALVNSYRGNLGDGSFDHNYNWFDPYHHTPAPNDDLGQGTFLTGIVSGDDGAQNQIGVAPGADWIAAKACDGGACSDVEIYASLEWMLAPTDLGGGNADPSKAPDIILAGWGSGFCSPTLEMYMNAFRAAGILPVFAGGRGGPACGSYGCPGELESVLSAGATDENDMIASWSPRGPSDGGLIKPDIVAPGVNIRSSFINGDYTTIEGSAEASAHAAGTAALIISANPYLSLNELEEILFSTALCIDDPSCGGGPCPEPNNVYGHGRIDAYEAVYAALGYPSHGDLPWLAESPISGTLEASEGVGIQVTFDATGLPEGLYTGSLGILTTDPITPFIKIPVTLTVIEACQPISTIEVNIEPAKPYVAEEVNFSAIATGTLPITYTWSLEGGVIAHGAQITHTFTNPGMHVISLVVQNPCTIPPIETEVDVMVKQIFLLPMVSK